MKNTRNIIIKLKDKDQDTLSMNCSIYNEMGSHIQNIAYTIRKNEEQKDFNNVLDTLTRLKVFNFSFSATEKKELMLINNYLEKKEEKVKKIKKEVKKNQEKYINNEKYVDFYVGIETCTNTKTTEFKLLCYNSNKEIILKKEMYENRKVNDEDFFEILKESVKSLQQEGKSVKLYGKGLLFPLFHRLNKELKVDGFKDVELKDGTGKLSTESAYKRINNYMNTVYDDLNNLQNKYVYFLDGSVADGENKYASAFLCRNANEMISSVGELSKKEEKDYYSSSYSEIIALSNAIDYMIINRQDDKPIHLVFDSDSIAIKLKNGLKEIYPERINRIDIIMKEICEKIKLNKLDIKVNVLKSHSEEFIHDIFKYNKIVDEFVRKSLTNGSQIKKLTI